MEKRVVIFIFSVFLFISCSLDNDDLFDPNAKRIPIEIVGEVSFADPNLFQEAKDLHIKLQAITQRGIAFGQQGAISGSVGVFDPTSLDSDFNDTANDYPAIIGFELGGLELMDPSNPDPNITDYRKELITKANENGSIITISWHTTNPITNENSFDLTSAVPEMLENGTHREVLSISYNLLCRPNGLQTLKTALRHSLFNYFANNILCLSLIAS